jgi:LPS export ABC transporter permease LptG/LPS export ABC transporter permease LptF
VFRIIGRYVFREILTSSVLGTVMATFVVFLQKVDRLFEVLVAGNPDAKTVILLLLYTIPPVLPLTIPFGVLVGILIGLGRMASDGEIIAMRAAGVSSRKVIAPVLLFAALGTALAGLASLRLTPYSLRQSEDILYRLAANQASANIQPRIFDENVNPNTLLYVNDVRPGDPAQWRDIFIADTTDPSQRKAGIGQKADGPMITVARFALAVSDPKNNRIQLNLRDYSTHEMGKDGVAYDDSAPVKTVALETKPPDDKTFAASSMNTRELLRYRGPEWINVGLELHRRFTYPLACIVLALVGIPVGISTRKGGRSAAYVNAIFLAFFGYYLSAVSLVGVAQRRRLPIPVASWLPDAVFGIAGLIFLVRMELPGDTDLLSQARDFIGRVIELFKRKAEMPVRAPKPATGRFTGWRLPLLPQIVDTYILSNFVFYMVLVLASFVSMTEVFNFFELMGDMLRNSTLMTMFTYLFFLIPQLIYRLLPISVLMAVLVTLGVLSKQNEVTAFKACGVSLYRMAAPVLISSMFFGGALFGFDYSYVPAANRRQDALRDQIKGRVTQTYLNPNSKWIMGSDSRIYFYKYFDSGEKTMAGVSVFELDPASFRLRRQIQAQRAVWRPSLHTWVFENGWSSDFRGVTRVVPRNNFQATAFPELNEAPDYFLKEAVLERQMNFLELQKYISDLQQSGLVDTRKLQVQYQLKFANPLFALIMAMIAVPFGFLVGNRGAMTGIGASIVIAISYLGIQPLFEKIGDVGLLPPTVAAWSPDLLFSLVGMYLLLRMRS